MDNKKCSVALNDKVQAANLIKHIRNSHKDLYQIVQLCLYNQRLIILFLCIFIPYV